MKPGVIILLIAVAIALNLVYAKAVHNDYRCAFTRCVIVK